jgi:hypothetical protein
VVQLRGELVPAAHVETLRDEPEGALRSLRYSETNRRWRMLSGLAVVAQVRDGARVIQLRGELVPAAHFETLPDEPEVLRERLEGARLVPELELVDFSRVPITMTVWGRVGIAALVLFSSANGPVVDEGEARRPPSVCHSCSVTCSVARLIGVSCPQRRLANLSFR